jgi:two-component system, sensor histidine kinase and response regulator
MTTPIKILIVDDDEVNTDILSELLSKDYSIKIAHSGEKALDILDAFMPELILLDIIMPGINGYEVCRRIKKQDRHRFVKILLISSKIHIDERLEGYRAGADDYITKPFDKDELVAKIRVFLQLKHVEEVDCIKSDLLSLFSHETRTPLSGIIGFADMLMSDERLPADVKKSVQMILESGENLLNFVKKTALLCELKSGIAFSPSYGIVEDHLKKVIGSFKSQAADKNIELFLEQTDSWAINADWELLDLVFAYLLDNSIRLSPPGAQVRVTVSGQESICTIAFTDTGDGIKCELIDKIFDEFTITDITHHQKGQGLSLAISKRIIELHEGSIAVRNSDGAGATFYLNIPQ